MRGLLPLCFNEARADQPGKYYEEERLVRFSGKLQ